MTDNPKLPSIPTQLLLTSTYSSDLLHASCSEALSCMILSFLYLLSLGSSGLFLGYLGLPLLLLLNSNLSGLFFLFHPFVTLDFVCVGRGQSSQSSLTSMGTQT
jgi:hypothetical protein